MYLLIITCVRRSELFVEKVAFMFCVCAEDAIMTQSPDGWCNIHEPDCLFFPCPTHILIINLYVACSLSVLRIHENAVQWAPSRDATTPSWDATKSGRSSACLRTPWAHQISNKISNNRVLV